MPRTVEPLRPERFFFCFSTAVHAPAEPLVQGRHVIPHAYCLLLRLDKSLAALGYPHA